MYSSAASTLCSFISRLYIVTTTRRLVSSVFAFASAFAASSARTVADGDLVVVHTHERYNPDDPSDLGNIIMDIYRVKNGLIVEHWDAYMPVPPKDKWLHANGSF